MNSKQAIKIVNNRFHNLLISYDYARKQHALELGLEDEENTKPIKDEKRQLLEVEQSARQNRKDEEISKAANFELVAAELNDEIEQAFLEQIQDIELICQLMGIADSVPATLDILSVKAASIGRIEPLVASQLWLTADIIKFVNLPIYQRSDKSAKLKVDKLHTALSYIGLENLPFVIPSFSLKQWIPSSTEPFRLMKRKLWENGIAAAICCRKLAQIHEEPEAALFTAGMFHDLGKSGIVRLYFRLFDEIWKMRLIEARNNRVKSKHDALVDMEPDPDELRRLMQDHSAKLSAKIVEHFNLKRLMFLSGMEEISEELDYKKMSKQGQLLAKGIAFSRYKTLQKHNLLDVQEAKAYFAAYDITAAEMVSLRTLSLKRLNLRLG